MSTGAEGGGADEAFALWLAVRAPHEPVPPEARRRARLAFLSALAEAPPLARTRRPFRTLVLALAAAAILAVTFLLPEPTRWHARLNGPLRFAEADFQPGDEARLAVELEGSGTVETAGARARFTLGKGLDVELLAGSVLAFPTLPELDGISTVAFELTRGEAYLRTSGAYPGNPIVVRTALAEVALNGTTLGVRVDELGTCVCVSEGSARVTSLRLPERQREVGARTSLRVYLDTTAPAKSEAFPSESGSGTVHTDDLVGFQHSD